MLQLATVEQEIGRLLETSGNIRGNKDKEKEYKRNERRVSYLNSIKLFLKNQPTEEYLQEEIRKLEHRLKVINNGYKTWLSGGNNDPNKPNPRAEYDSIMGTAKIKRHLKNACYILKG